MANWYVGSTKYTAVAQWAANHVYAAGSIVRCLRAETAGNERCYLTAAGGTSHATTEPTWVLTKAAAQPADGTVSDWVECTGNNSWGWTAAHARLESAIAWGAAGDTYYVSNNHTQTVASALIITFNGTAAAPDNCLCVSDAATPPTTLATTASVATTSTSALTVGGFAYIYGLIFSSGGGSSAANIQLGTSISATGIVAESCLLKLNTTSTGTRMTFGGIGSATSIDRYVKLINTTVQFGSVSQHIRCGGNIVIENLILAGSAPTTLFAVLASNHAIVRVSASNLSSLGSNNLIDPSAAAYGEFYFRNCKLGTNFVPIVNAIPGQGGTQVFFDNCDSGDTNYKMSHYKYQGSIVQETTIILTGGASDGATGISHKMVSLTGGPSFAIPLRGVPITIWNETTGSSKTATVEILHDSATNLKDDDIWLELEYLGTSGFPLSTVGGDRKTDIMATGADQTDSSATWTTTGMSNPNNQKLVVTFTPQEKGLIRATVCLAKANYTVYVDPLLVIT